MCVTGSNVVFGTDSSIRTHTRSHRAHSHKLCILCMCVCIRLKHFFHRRDFCGARSGYLFFELILIKFVLYTAVAARMCARMLKKLAFRFILIPPSNRSSCVHACVRACRVDVRARLSWAVPESLRFGNWLIGKPFRSDRSLACDAIERTNHSKYNHYAMRISHVNI